MLNNNLVDVIGSIPANSADEDQPAHLILFKDLSVVRVLNASDDLVISLNTVSF
jgi:hypothetical protein